MAQSARLCHVHPACPGGAELQAGPENTLPTASGLAGGGGGHSHAAWL